MKDNILFSLFTGILAYSLTVLISLLLGISLPRVLYNGLKALVIIGAITMAVTYYIEKASEKSEDRASGSNNEKENIDNSTQEKESSDQENEHEQNEDEFSAMDPTVLEVEEEDVT